MPHSSTSVYVHLVWSTKDRAPLIPVEADDVVAAAIRARCERMACGVEAIGMSDDHVHLLVTLGSNVKLAELLQHAKGGAAWDLNASGRLPHRIYWQGSYWASSVSASLVPPVKSYISRQREHHRSGRLEEQWEPDTKGGMMRGER